MFSLTKFKNINHLNAQSKSVTHVTETNVLLPPLKLNFNFKLLG
jgi:hypothetical protein